MGKTKTGPLRYDDPEGFGPDSVKLLKLPLERAAVGLWLCSWNVPEDAAVSLARDGGKHAWALWASPTREDGASASEWKAKDRHLYRRRAALALHGEL